MAEVSGAFPLKRIVRSVLLGVLISGAVCIALLALMAVVMTGVDVPKPAVTPIALACPCAGAFIGGFFAALVARKYGWLVGILSGLLLFLFILLGGFALSGEVRTLFALLKLVLLPVSGMLGGMLGVNLRRRR